MDRTFDDAGTTSIDGGDPGGDAPDVGGGTLGPDDVTFGGGTGGDIGPDGGDVIGGGAIDGGIGGASLGDRTFPDPQVSESTM